MSDRAYIVTTQRVANETGRIDMTVGPEYTQVEKPLIDQLTKMGWTHLEGAPLGAFKPTDPRSPPVLISAGSSSKSGSEPRSSTAAPTGGRARPSVDRV
jgi:hypothetical protein